MMKRPFRDVDRRLGQLFRLANHVARPLALVERLRFGPLYRRKFAR
jgi:hypothetical protein